MCEDGHARNRREVNRKTVQAQQYHRCAGQDETGGRAKPNGEDCELHRGRNANQITPARVVVIRKSCRNSDDGGYGETAQGASEICELGRPSLGSGDERSGRVGKPC